MGNESSKGGGAKQSPLRKLAAGCIVAAGVAYVLTLFISGLSDQNAAERDFISYWAAGQLAVHGANPYDFRAVSGLELAAGRGAAEPVLMMRNPPIALPLAAPLGWVRPKTGLILWLILLLGCVALSLWLLWRLHGKPDTYFHLLGFIFAPVLACFMAGQFGIFLLTGVVLFLYFHRSRPWLAGAALLLCAFKPHLFLPLAIPLLLWIARGIDRERRFRILAGFAVALAVSCGLTYTLDPHAWTQYLHMLRIGRAADEAVPALSVFFSRLISPNTTWLRFVPEAAAVIWAAWYAVTRRAQWDWGREGLLILLVSAVCTPYAWYTDEAMLLPAVLAGVYVAVESRHSLIPLAIFAGAALVETFANVQITTPYYLWTTPAWLGWYLYATRNQLPRAQAS
jgi:hypothetical protein